MAEQEINQDTNNEESSPLTEESMDQEQQTPTAELSETEKLKAELGQSKDQYLRLVAEFDNFRKRTAREKVETIQTAGKELIQSLLAVLDDKDRADKIWETATDMNAVKEGVTLVMGKLTAILASKGLKPMETAQGDEFDAELHEAITEIPAPTETLQGKVVDVIEKGYYLNDKLIRHAKVVVGK